MKVKCYSVRLQSLTPISDRCYKAKAFDGSEDLIPASQVFGPDYEVGKSEAWYISAWILDRKNIQFSTKKERWFNTDTGAMLPSFHIEKHVPTVIHVTKTEPDASLIR